MWLRSDWIKTEADLNDARYGGSNEPRISFRKNVHLQRLLEVKNSIFIFLFSWFILSIQIALSWDQAISE